MADTQKKFDDIIRKIALVVKLVNEEIDDEPIMNEVDYLNDEISDLTCDIMGEKNDFLSYKDLDKYCADLLGKNYFDDKRCWSYLHDSMYDIFYEMNNIIDDEFEEEMQTGLGMAQQLPTNSTYDSGIFDIYNNDEEEKKDMDKRLKEKKNSIIDEIQDLIDDTDYLSDVSFDMDENEISSADNVIEYIEDRINEIEVIYYSNALKILSENDPSLQTSLGYAEDMGYSCGNLNSELLATILCQESAREELYNIRDDIEEVVEEWLEDNDEEE